MTCLRVEVLIFRFLGVCDHRGLYKHELFYIPAAVPVAMDGCCGRQKDLSAGSWSVREDARHNSQSVTGTNPTERHILVFQTLLLALGP